MLLLLYLLAPTSHSCAAEPTGPNTCSRQVVETKQVNTTFLQAVRVKKFEPCWTLRIPPTCPKWVDTFETRWKPEEVTRVRTVSECCPGYREQAGGCSPSCPLGCGEKGECLAPGACTCHPGWSGQNCEREGCPGGRWGQGCSQPCLCQNQGQCSPATGSCSCPPGYSGVLCEVACEEGRWGLHCEQECTGCEPGTQCHHVTGECVGCEVGKYGPGCNSACSCSQEGTELCSPRDGRCFCRANYFGSSCERECPFGFVNGTCLLLPQTVKEANQSVLACNCPNNLYVCHPQMGCLCPQGLNCGFESETQVEVLSLPSSDIQDTRSSSTAAVVCVLLVALVVLVLVIAYYKRRIRSVKRDNRAVYYSDSMSRDMDLASIDLVLPEPQQQQASPNNLQGMEVLNNVRLNLTSQINVLANANKPVKNTNIENLKLGRVSPIPSGSCHSSGNELEPPPLPDGASAIDDSDVNVFKEDVKSNAFSHNKAVKADLEVMIRNNLSKESNEEKLQKKSNNSEKDDLGKMKVRLP